MFCREAIIIVISCRFVVVLAAGFVPATDVILTGRFVPAIGTVFVGVVVVAAGFVPTAVLFVVFIGVIEAG